MISTINFKFIYKILKKTYLSPNITGFMQLENFSLNIEMIKSGKNFLGILNDIKRRPEDATKELQISLDEINLIINGKKLLPSEIINKAIKIWPVNARDFYVIQDVAHLELKL
jgi:hypothetical protein